jgi:hypothetical protein
MRNRKGKNFLIVTLLSLSGPMMLMSDEVQRSQMEDRQCAATSARFVGTMKFPAAPEVVVVAEGDCEPASVGSYSVRIYSGLNPYFPLDEYVTGVVRPRDGAIEQVKFPDVDGDGHAEIVVVIRSAGSGSYVSADAFTYANKSITLLASVSGVAKNADPLPVLTAAIKKGSQ